jgi:hypothetical protein
MNLPKLNIPFQELRKSEKDGKIQIFDRFRNHYVALTPEEWVRQQFLNWMVNHYQYPEGLIAVEVPMKYQKLSKRADAVVYLKSRKPAILIECKAPHINVTEETFEQAVRYNFVFQTPYIILTNGMTHYCCFINHAEKRVQYLDKIPVYSILKEKSG